MRSCCRIILMIATLLFASCNSGEGEDSVETSQTSLGLIATVPSDALAIVLRSKCEEALTLLESSDKLRTLNFGCLLKSPALLSWTYDGKLSALLTLDLGRTEAHKAAAESLVEEAADYGIFTLLIDASDSLSPLQTKRSMLLLSSSEVILNAAEVHINESRSIMDAPGFEDALHIARKPGAKNWAILRNQGLSRLLPNNFLQGIYTRSQVSKFLQGTAEWTVICPSYKAHYTLEAVFPEVPSYYMQFLSSLPHGESRLGDILETDPGFAISLPLPKKGFREGYQRYLDATVRSTAYKRELNALKERSGKDPLEWERELDVKEVVLIVSGDSKLAALRVGKESNNSQIISINPNMHQGFIPALYGRAFEIPDDSACAAVGEWLLYGEAEDITTFLQNRSNSSEIKLPRKGVHVIVYNSGSLLCWDKKGIRLWNLLQ